MALKRLSDLDENVEFWTGTRIRLIHVDFQYSFYDYILSLNVAQNGNLYLVNITDNCHKAGYFYANEIKIDKSRKRTTATNGELKVALGGDFENAYLLEGRMIECLEFPHDVETNPLTPTIQTETSNRQHELKEKVMTSDQAVIRVLTQFAKDGDHLLDEFELKGIELKELQMLFQRPVGDPMYACYPVSESEAKYLQKYVNEPIDVASYDYFVECYAVDEKLM